MVDERPTKALAPQAGDCIESVAGGQPAVEAAVPGRSEQVVHRESGPVERRRPEAAVYREHKGLQPDEVGGDPKQPGSFAQGLSHEADLKLLEVAKTAVDQSR